MEQIYTIPVNEAFEESAADASCGCPFCRLFNKLEDDELDLILGASMMEPDVRIQTNREGFCRTHYDMMFVRKNRLGMALTLESHLAELTDEIRNVVADMAIGTRFYHSEPAPGGMDLSGVDLEAMADALGLTTEELMALAQGEMELNELDLGRIDLEGLVNAAGMTEADLFEMIRSESGLDALDLSVVDLDEIDLEALVAALGITEEEAFALIEGELEPTEVDLSGMDVAAVLAALGLTVEDVIDIIMPLVLESMGLENMDWKGLLGGIGKGFLIGTAAGVAVVILIIVLLAVTGRKKRGKVQEEQPAVEGASEE